MLAIQAKETRYNGNRFRSRLEARWAVFFDALGIKYWYEYQDYGSGKYRYLPDFYLPECKTWVEIKPFWPTNLECEKAIRLCVTEQQFVIILAGNPWPEEYHTLFYHPISYTPEEFVDHLIRWERIESLSKNPTPGKTVLHFRAAYQVVQMNDCTPLVEYIADIGRGFMCRKVEIDQCPECQRVGPFDSRIYDPQQLCYGCLKAYVTPRLKGAFTRARQARFEHGERGAP